MLFLSFVYTSTLKCSLERKGCFPSDVLDGDEGFQGSNVSISWPEPENRQQTPVMLGQAKFRRRSLTSFVLLLSGSMQQEVL